MNPNDPPPEETATLPKNPEEEIKQNLDQIRSTARSMQTQHEEELDQYRKALDMVGKFIKFLSDEQPESDEKFDQIHCTKTRSYYVDHGKASELFEQVIPINSNIALLARCGSTQSSDAMKNSLTNLPQRHKLLTSSQHSGCARNQRAYSGFDRIG